MFIFDTLPFYKTERKCPQFAGFGLETQKSIYCLSSFAEEEAEKDGTEF